MKLVWSGFSGQGLVQVVLLLFTINAQQLSAQQPTNLEVLSSVIDSTLEGALRDVLGKGSCVSVHSLSPEGESNWLIESRLSEFFSQNGISVTVPGHVSGGQGPAADDSCQTMLEYKVVSLGIQYRGEQTTDILMRTARIHIYLRTIFVDSGEIGMNMALKLSKEDQVAHDRVPELEDKAVPFTVGEIQWQPGGPRIVRPLVVSVAAGVIVYLFYSLRSR